jgi:hypothetical protein
MSEVYRWTGHLERDLATGGLVGELVDPFGFVIRLVATRGSGCYAIIGTPGAVPAAYAVPWIDDETPGEAVSS